MTASEADLCYAGADNLEIMDAATNYNAFLRGLVKTAADRGGNLLDFGAGSGVLARPLAASGYRVTCVEPDARLRARLAADTLVAHAGIEAIAPASVDLIYTVNVLEHIEDDAGAVAALRDRLRPGGRLLVYVPAFPILYSSMDRKVGHVRRYRRAGLAALLREAGMQVERIAYCDCLGFAAALLFKAVGGGDGTLNRRALIAYDRFIFPLSRLLDRVAGPWIGKNLIALARRDG